MMFMKVPVYDLEGKTTKEITLPEVFSEEIRPDLINRAYLAVRSRSYQPKGVYRWAGLETSAEYIGRRRAYRAMINTGLARLPRVKLPKGRFGEVRRVPFARKGRRAHPPKVEKKLVEKINKKENRKAIRSAIAATASIDYVKKRGHRIDSLKTPIIVSDSFESLKKTREVKDFLKKIKLDAELKRAEKKTIRAGRGKTRGRKYRRKKSLLVVVNSNKGILKAARGIPGIDVSFAKNLNAELLAPGGAPGRLTLFTESAVDSLKNYFKV